jgi:hypothetical protein
MERNSERRGRCRIIASRLTVFSIDPEKKAHCTGFAGECWRRNGQTIASPGPLPDQRGENLTEYETTRYITDGWLADEEYNCMSVKARVFLATGIKINGKL